MKTYYPFQSYHETDIEAVLRCLMGQIDQLGHREHVRVDLRNPKFFSLGVLCDADVAMETLHDEWLGRLKAA